MEQRQADSRTALKEFTVQLKLLSSPKSGGIRTACTQDLTSRFERLLSLVEKSSQDIGVGQATKIHALLFKLATKPATKNRAAAEMRLTNSTVESGRKILVAITRVLKGSGAKSRVSKRAVTLEMFLRGCTSTLVRLAAVAESGAAWAQPLEYLRVASSICSLPFETVFSEEYLGPLAEQMEKASFEALRTELENGGIGNASAIYGSLRLHPGLKKSADALLSKLLSERASTFPPNSQKWIMKQLEIESSEQVFDYASPADRPDVKQAAALLLYLFDQRMQTPSMGEAFERYKALAESHFQLFLRGEVGAVSDFDSRLHEVIEGAGARVKLVRPWVEWFKPPESRVVIRGIVEAQH